MIRKRMDERLTLMDRMNLSIEEQLEKSGLINKNRGIVKEHLTSGNLLKVKMNKKLRKVSFG